MEFHEVSNIFPLMEGKEFELLKEDIKKNGLHEPIYKVFNKIIDGRNRYRACMELGITPTYLEWSGNDPLAFVISMNLHRRHLSESQRAVIASKLANMPKHIHKDNVDTQICVSQSDAAEMMNVSPRIIQEVKSIEREAPELIPDIEKGEITVHEASKEVKERKRIKDIEELEVSLIDNPDGLFDVIVLDPPWPYGTKYDPEGRRSASPYPEMSLEDISKLELPSSNDCVLWLWTTHKFMRHSFELLDTWGFRDVAILTWVKDKMGTGNWLRSQSEFCIMAVKGKPKVNLTNQTTIVYGSMREHSRKPDEFYGMVNSLCVGRKLDYFSREFREGYEQFGNEVRKFNELAG